MHATSSELFRHHGSGRSQGRDYTVIFIVVIIVLIFSISLWLLVVPSVGGERFFSTIHYISKALLQAYAAIIAIPFTIAIVHLQSKYGYASINIDLQDLKL